MQIMNSCRGLVDTYLAMMKDIVLANLGHYVSAVIPLTRISILQCVNICIIL